MPRRLSAEDVVAAVYEEEGFYEVEREEDPESDYITRLILSNGKKEIAVSILSEEAFLSKGSLQDALLKAEKLKEKFDGVIIAVPRKFQRAVDEDVMSLHGFGFVIYDKLGAEELLPPRLSEKPQKDIEPPTRVRGIEEEELVNIRRELSKLLRALEELEVRLDRLEKEQNKIVSRLSKVESGLYELEKRGAVKAEKTIERAEPIKEPEPKRRGKLPSYLQDNPWVDILSRRE
ncbi:MAG: hypothetical protein J7J94_02465 [Thaumarchaeota archaeon]|nr:hypothetical protein [Nitrososphaerota archaeon]